MTPFTPAPQEAAAASPREWLIRKGGYYYRSDWCGYTVRKDEAGRYTEAEARKEAELEPRHMKALHQDDVPNPPPTLYDDALTDDALARIMKLEAENARLRADVATARRDGWVAGRDAAADHVDNLTNAYAVRALAPPAAADGGGDV